MNDRFEKQAQIGLATVQAKEIILLSEHEFDLHLFLRNLERNSCFRCLGARFILFSLFSALAGV